MCYITSILLFIAFVILFIKYNEAKNDIGNYLLDLEGAYNELKTDQLERGYTDIGGLKAKYFTKKRKYREKMLDEYVKNLQNTRKRLGKKNITYSHVDKTWNIDEK